MIRSGILVGLSLALVACGAPSSNLVDEHLKTSSRDDFVFCRDFVCSTKIRIGLTDAEWAEATALLQDAPASAEAERAAVAQIIGSIETIVGPKGGTSNDRAGAEIIPLRGSKGQQDCIDESANTSMYLHFMARDGLLRFHEVGDPENRGYIINRWFHNTATLIDRGTGQIWAVDSWFRANGAPADIVAIETWKAGWEPEDFSSYN